MEAGGDDSFRCGRRKQRNPRRKNEDDSGVEQDLNDADLPAAGEHSRGSPPPLTNGLNSEDSDSAHSEKEAEVADSPADQDSEGPAASESQALVTSSGQMTEESHDQPSGGDKATAMKDSTGLSQETPPLGSDPLRDSSSSPDKSDNVMEAKDEADQIQELMTRKDTAVIFPEPVSDHEDSGRNNDDEVVDEEEGEDSLDKEEEQKCPQCPQTFRREFLLSDHVLAQHPELAGKHSCPQCGATFALHSQLEKHLALHSPTSQVCKICKKTFANVYRLQRHMISHEESTELRKFKCPECGKAFKFKHHLKEHVRIHSGEKPFACSNCGKRFSHSGSYSSHMTSKKCWVVSLRSPRKGDSIKLPDRPDGLLRPLVPKAHDNGKEISLPYQNLYPPHLMPFDPTGGHLQAQIMAQMNGSASGLQAQILAQFNGTRPFLPQMSFGVGHMMMPGTAPPFGFPSFPQEKTAEELGGETEKVISNGVSKLNSSSESTNSVDENQNAKTAEKSKKEGENTHGEDDESKMEKSSGEVSKDASKAHLEAVKKVLEIVDATVSEQQKNSTQEDKTSFSKLVQQEQEQGLSVLASAAEKLLQLGKEAEESSDIEQKGTPTSLRCRFCQDRFSGPIDLHQHERYLCKQNKDIHSPGSCQPSQQSHSTDMHSRNGPPSPSSISTERTEEEMEENDENVPEKEIRRGRARSFITEPQSSFLRAHYNVNPFPTKIELQNIADKIKLAKRVVQVWFQNMRARDRRRGKKLPEPSQSSPSTGSIAPVGKATPPLASSYIPVVPQVPFMPPVPGDVGFPSRFNGQLAPPHSQPEAQPQPTTTRNLTFSMQQEPLDLSTHRKPQAAHCNNVTKPYQKPPSDDIVLNLSTKQNMDSDSGSQQTAILKYAQQEGTVPVGDVADEPRVSPPQWPHAPLTINTIPAHSNFRSSSTPERSLHPMTSTPVRPAHSPSQPPGSPALMSSPIATPPPSSLDSSFNSTLSGDSGSAALQLKPKRARRKSWRQMESEEAQMEFDEDEEDEDQPLRKKRRSWKHHRIEAADGLYACDQCDKMFNKQSSLARHKYEHSGQRPFPCEICGKAFKHKHHLTEHKRLHSGEKPFICKKCGKRFSHSGSFSQHMNHRYKYCKPLRLGEGQDSENDQEREESPEFEPLEFPSKQPEFVHKQTDFQAVA